jgi:hypothetical protein
MAIDARISSAYRPGHRTFPAFAFANQDGLPLVVGWGAEFLDWNLAAPRVPPRVYLMDQAAELKYAGTTGFGEFPVAVRFFGLPAYDWKAFTADHRAFLLVWNRATSCWILKNALEEGGKIQVLQADESYTLFLVELPAVHR